MSRGKRRSGKRKRGLKPHQQPTLGECPEKTCSGTIRRAWSEKYERHFFGCTNYRGGCGAGVGCDKDGKPLGTPATHKVRQARRRAHVAFDPMWRGGKMSRGEAYGWLADAIGKSHIAEMDLDDCERLIAIVERMDL
jgi:hypothetical protein